MSLSKLKNPTPSKQVQVTDEESFPVRGLNPDDIMGIYYRHTGDLSGLFEKLFEGFQSNGDRIDPNDLTAVALDLMRDAPHIMAEIIAAAAGGNPRDDEAWMIDVAIALKLPFAVQADALQKIVELTFTSEMPPKKFGNLVVALWMRATGKLSI